MNSVKRVVLTALVALISLYDVQAMDLERIRANYQKAVSDRTLCKEMIEELSNNATSAVHQAYLGGFQTIWATHVFNPVSKLATFNKGRKNIDEAVESNPTNAEVRFIRLSVQSNCPAFLGYRSNIEEDRTYLRTHSKSIQTALLKKMIADIF